jgi:transposase InsO family protein
VFCGPLSRGSSLHAGIESPEPVRRRPGDPRRAADADLVTVNRENYSVYGVKKMHQAMKRKGWKVGREQTRRLMKKAGLRCVQRGKPVFTTITDPAAARPAIWLTADSVPKHLTGYGSPTSLSCAPGRVLLHRVGR